MNITVKETISKSVEFMNNGLDLESNLKQSACKNNSDCLYIKACIAYNYKAYEKSLSYIIELYNLYSKIDHNLFSYSSYGFLVENKFINPIILSDVCKIHREIKDLYDHSHLDLLNKSMYYYVSKEKHIPSCIIEFLGSVVSNKVIKKIYESSSPEDRIVNQCISSLIDFEKLSNKNIVHAFYNESSSGMGDFLRGSCYLFDLLSKENIKLHINFSKHDISKYLKSSTNFRFKKSKIFDTEKVNKILCIGKNYIQNIKDNIVSVFNNSTEDPIYLFTNYCELIDSSLKADRVVLTKNCRKFMQSNLIFSKEVKKEGNRIISSMPSSDFAVAHFRLGDRLSLTGVDGKDMNKEETNTKQYNIEMNNLLQTIKDKQQESNKHIIVMSDCNYFKEYVKNGCTKEEGKFIHIIHTNSQHCSNNPGNIDKLTIDRKNKIDNMFYVALDMYLISKSSSIYSYSVYPWGSGFVFWLAKIFNIQILTNQIGV